MMAYLFVFSFFLDGSVMATEVEMGTMDICRAVAKQSYLETKPNELVTFEYYCGVFYES